MEPEGSLPRSQELATCRYPERKACMYELHRIIILHNSLCSYMYAYVSYFHMHYSSRKTELHFRHIQK